MTFGGKAATSDYNYRVILSLMCATIPPKCVMYPYLSRFTFGLTKCLEMLSRMCYQDPLILLDGRILNCENFPTNKNFAFSIYTCLLLLNSRNIY